MDKFSFSLVQLLAAIEEGKILVGEMFYKPIGIEPSGPLSAFTFYFLMGALAYGMLRLVLPSRGHDPNYERNEFGLRRRIER